ncbi:MAG: type IV pilus modification protein PilV [Gallionellales bacterium GWA2_60_142]|jgi:type IV pilus assembly protein PilV|nr:MAG: type IV pilus modification protein PilV [Gallionellales bacterium GWA2_60_142]
MRSHSHLPVISASQRGFSMLEVLITLVIIATALLGTAGLQMYALRTGQSGQFRTQAVFLASDISERMEVNKVAAVAGNYALALTSVPSVAATNCATTVCNSTDLASWDLSQWGIAIGSLLPQATWQITQTTAGNPSTYSIVINWTDRSSNKTSHGETFSYTATRTISN